MHKVAGSGSRSLLNLDEKPRHQVRDTTESRVLQLREEHDDLVLISGLAEGWDELIAFIAVKHGIPLHAYVPHPTYGEYYWGRQSLTGTNRTAKFNFYVDAAQYVHYTSNGPLYIDNVHVNFLRNQDMVDAADHFLVYKPESSGTKDCVARMKKAQVSYEVYPFTEQLTLV